MRSVENIVPIERASSRTFLDEHGWPRSRPTEWAWTSGNASRAGADINMWQATRTGPPVRSTSTRCCADEGTAMNEQEYDHIRALRAQELAARGDLSPITRTCDAFRRTGELLVRADVEKSLSGQL